MKKYGVVLAATATLALLAGCAPYYYDDGYGYYGRGRYDDGSYRDRYRDGYRGSYYDRRPNGPGYSYNNRYRYRYRYYDRD